MVSCGMSRPPERTAVKSDAAPTTPSQRLPATRLKRFTTDALLAVGLPAQDAATCAELMVRADLQGADGHGVFRLPQYVRRIRGGAYPAHVLRQAENSVAVGALEIGAHHQLGADGGVLGGQAHCDERVGGETLEAGCGETRRRSGRGCVGSHGD